MLPLVGLDVTKVRKKNDIKKFILFGGERKTLYLCVMNKEERYQYIRGQFLQRGFVTDPRGESYERSLYNPELNITVHICGISRLSAAIHVFDMSENGMTWGKAFYELRQGCEIRYNFEKRSFESFYNVTFKNRVKKLNEILEKLK